MIITIPCSPEQEDVIADHLLAGAQIGMQPDERAWIVAYTKKLHPGAVVLAADLDMSTATWAVEIRRDLFSELIGGVDCMQASRNNTE